MLAKFWTLGICAFQLSLFGQNCFAEPAKAASPMSGAGKGIDDRSEHPTKARDHESSIRVVLQDWTDEKRSRVIPVKLYFPASIASGSCPVVIFSHGLGGSRDAAQYLGEYWASKGYVGIFMQHAGSDTAVWAKGNQLSKASFMANMRAAANGKNLVDRAADVKFVIDELHRTKSSTLFQDKLNLDKIAVAGHSFGAGTSLALAGQNFGIVGDNLPFLDKRIKSAIYLCPPIIGLGKANPAKAYGSIQIPGLLLTGTEDNSSIGNTTAEDRRIPFDGARAPHQFLVNFYGADHATFGGRSFRQAKSSDESFHKMIEEVTGKFLDATLKNDQAAWTWLEQNGIKDYLANAAQVERK